MNPEVIIPVLGIMTGIIVPLAVFVWLYLESIFLCLQKTLPCAGQASIWPFALYEVSCLRPGLFEMYLPRQTPCLRKNGH